MLALTPHRLSETFRRFFDSEARGAILLAACTIVSLAIANSPLATAYSDFWHLPVAGLTVEHWINDGLMAVFVPSSGRSRAGTRVVRWRAVRSKNRAAPILAALGGVAVPAAMHYALNAGTPSQAGMGIPMATDIAFALGALALPGSRVPASLKVFLAALAVMDDLGAIIVIAVFYTASISYEYLAAAMGVLAVLVILNRSGVMRLGPYLLLEPINSSKVAILAASVMAGTCGLLWLRMSLRTVSAPT